MGSRHSVCEQYVGDKLTQRSCLSAGPAADGLGAQAICG